MKYFLDLADSGTLVFWMKSPNYLATIHKTNFQFDIL